MFTIRQNWLTYYRSSFKSALELAAQLIDFTGCATVEIADICGPIVVLTNG